MSAIFALNMKDKESTEKLNLMYGFLKLYQWSDISEGWMMRDKKLTALGINRTEWVPVPINIRDVKKYIEAEIVLIKAMLAI